MPRPRVHRDDAARAAAWRDRQAALAIKGELLDKPTLTTLRGVARRLAAKSKDPEALGRDAVRILLEGLEEGGGAGCADAARRFVRDETDSGAVTVGGGQSQSDP